uniref:PLAT domain-containing protein n=1 Tax=Macrostomum lignano TaxID=282301 RepID=A0A1I8FL80_9PLAT
RLLERSGPIVRSRITAVLYLIAQAPLRRVRGQLSLENYCASLPDAQAACLRAVKGQLSLENYCSSLPSATRCTGAFLSGQGQLSLENYCGRLYPMPQAPPERSGQLSLENLLGPSLAADATGGRLLSFCFDRSSQVLNARKRLPQNLRDFSFWKSQNVQGARNAELQQQYDYRIVRGAAAAWQHAKFLPAGRLLLQHIRPASFRWQANRQRHALILGSHKLKDVQCRPDRGLGRLDAVRKSGATAPPDAQIFFPFFSPRKKQKSQVSQSLSLMMKPSSVKPAKEVAQVYSNLAAYPVPQSAQLLPQYPFSDAIRTRCVYQRQDLATGRPSGPWLLKLKAEGSGSDNADKFVVHVYNESRFIKSNRSERESQARGVYDAGEAKSVGSKRMIAWNTLASNYPSTSDAVLCTLDVDSRRPRSSPCPDVLTDGHGTRRRAGPRTFWALRRWRKVFVGYKELPISWRRECAVIGHDTRAGVIAQVQPVPEAHLCGCRYAEPSGPHKQCRRLIWHAMGHKGYTVLIDFVNQRLLQRSLFQANFTRPTACRLVAGVLTNSAAYAVLVINYRGSLGFGKIDRRLPARRHWRARDVSDCNSGSGGDDAGRVGLSSPEYLVALPRLDGEKLAAFGGSHGGAFLGGHSDWPARPACFKAAVLRNRGDQPGHHGRRKRHSRLGLRAERPAIPATTRLLDRETLALLCPKSPLSHASKVNTPTLVAVGLKDLEVAAAAAVGSVPGTLRANGGECSQLGC